MRTTERQYPNPSWSRHEQHYESPTTTNTKEHAAEHVPLSFKESSLPTQPRNPNFLSYQFGIFEEFLCDILVAPADMLGPGEEHEGIVELRNLVEHILLTLLHKKFDRAKVDILKKNVPPRDLVFLKNYLDRFEFFARMQWLSVRTVVEHGYADLLLASLWHPLCGELHDIAHKELIDIFKYTPEELEALKSI